MTYCRHCRRDRLDNEIPLHMFLLVLLLAMLLWIVSYPNVLARDCGAPPADARPTAWPPTFEVISSGRAHRMHRMHTHDTYRMRTHDAYGLPQSSLRP